MIQTATKIIGNNDKRKLEAYTQTKRADICVPCALDDMFFDCYTQHLRVKKDLFLSLVQWYSTNA